MTDIQPLCEAQDLSYHQLMEAVEAFIDELVEEPTVELYQATAKRLLGENLNHDEIMMDMPYCTPKDLFFVEKAPYVGDVELKISTDTQISAMLIKLRLGRKGLLSAYKEFRKRQKAEPHKTEGYIMAQVAAMYGKPAREMQVILTKMISKHEVHKEHMLQMAGNLLSEDTPVNTQGSAMPDRAPTDGNSHRKVKKRKKFSELTTK